MGIEEVGIAAGALAVLYVVIEKVVAPLIMRMTHMKNGNGSEKHKCTFDADMRDKVNALHGMHDVHDNDGIPMWYMPRTVADNIKDMLGIQRDVLNELRLLRKAFEKHEAS